MPPLRERPGDIVPIAERRLADVAAELPPWKCPPGRLLALLMAYPGRATSASCATSSRAPLGRLHDRRPSCPPAFCCTWPAPAEGGDARPAATGTLAGKAWMRSKAMVLRETPLRHRWNKTQATELGLSRVGLRAKMQRFTGWTNHVPPALVAGSGGWAAAACRCCAPTPPTSRPAEGRGIQSLWHPSLSLSNGARAAVGWSRCRPGNSGSTPGGRRRAAARPERQRAFPPAGRHRAADDRLGAALAAKAATWWRWAAARPGAASAAGANHRRLRPAVRRRPPGGLLGRAFGPRQRPAGHQHRRLPDAPQLGGRHFMALAPAPARAPTWTRWPTALLRRPAGAPRLHAQRVLRVQGQRREAFGPGLP